MDVSVKLVIIKDCNLNVTRSKEREKGRVIANIRALKKKRVVKKGRGAVIIGG